MANQETIHRGLAFLAITGKTIGLTKGVIEAMDPFRLASGKLSKRGEKIAHRHRLWKAHEYLLSQGFVLSESERHTLESIKYHHSDDTERQAVAGIGGRASFQKRRKGAFLTQRFKSDSFTLPQNGNGGHHNGDHGLQIAA